MALLPHANLATLCSRAYVELTGVTQDLEFLIVPTEDVTYVAIRGTEILSVLDMVRNIRFLPWYTASTGWAHAGFLSGAMAVADTLGKIISPRHRVVFTGHSLGAAIGVLCSQVFHQRGYDVAEVVLFGCPRIYPFGRPTFPYPVTSYRHGTDLICLMPRLYRHAVPPLALNPRRGIPGLADHGILRYEIAMNQKVPI